MSTGNEMTKKRLGFIAILIAIPVLAVTILLAAWSQLQPAAAPSAFKAMFNRIVVASKALDKGAEQTLSAEGADTK